MATARDESNPYGGGLGAGGKFRKRPFRRTTQTTPYDRPPTALRNPSGTGVRNGWLSKLVDPAQKLITSSAHWLFASVFRKRLPPPPQAPESGGVYSSSLFFFFFLKLKYRFLCVWKWGRLGCFYCGVFQW